MSHKQEQKNGSTNVSIRAPGKDMKNSPNTNLLPQQLVRLKCIRIKKNHKKVYSLFCNEANYMWKNCEPKNQTKTNKYVVYVYIVKNDCRVLRTRSDGKLKQKNDNVWIVAMLTSALRLSYSTAVIEQSCEILSANGYHRNGENARRNTILSLFCH